MENIIKAFQFILDAAGTGAATLGDIGAGTENVGLAQQLSAGAAGSFLSAIKTVFNFCASVLGMFGVEVGTVK